ncbi:hypothetical protein [Sporosarcina sp. Te-1]|uniref:hypothetical protein n=1 Tax=Sporosarcina sp. Te-1 TaxID=2818390 RepID=UPI001A9E7F46|nr:hypothetical protein [Sporosarcina sp. Te-1]QTD42764.1 hypothetical protein J3U78_08340 [Sporosarcina sp. Te-1]
MKLGSEDGYNLSKLAIDSLDDRFIASYQKGYKEGRSRRKAEVLADGYQSAFINMSYLEKEEYDNPELMSWYNEGFHSNEVASKIKETAFDDGYTNDDYKIPEEFKINKESVALYNSLFEEGQDIRDQEKQKKAMVATGIVLPAGGLAVGGFLLRKRRKKKLI